MKNSSGIKAFDTYLRKLRGGKDLSGQQPAEIAEVAKITIQRIGTAKYSVTPDVMIPIAKAIRLPLSELVNYKSRRNEEKTLKKPEHSPGFSENHLLLSVLKRTNNSGKYSERKS